MHGLIVGTPNKKRADPAVLRGLCSHTLPSGKNEVGGRDGAVAGYLAAWEGTGLTMGWLVVVPS